MDDDDTLTIQGVVGLMSRDSAMDGEVTKDNIKDGNRKQWLQGYLGKGQDAPGRERERERDAKTYV